MLDQKYTPYIRDHQTAALRSQHTDYSIVITYYYEREVTIIHSFKTSIIITFMN